jgi:hypothetical protein
MTRGMKTDLSLNNTGGIHINDLEKRLTSRLGTD